MYTYTDTHRGASQAANSSELLEQLSALRARRTELEKLESELDEQRHKMEQCLRNIAEDTTNDQYPPHPSSSSSSSSSSPSPPLPRGVTSMQIPKELTAFQMHAVIPVLQCVVNSISQPQLCHATLCILRQVCT